MFKWIKHILERWIYDYEEITIREFHDKYGHQDDVEIYNNNELKFIEKTIFDESFWVKSHNGWNKVKNSFKTVQYDVWQVKLNDDSIIRGADDHLVMNDLHEKQRLRSLRCGNLIQTKTGLQGVKYVQKFSRQENMYDLQLSDDSDHTFYTNDILSHNTTVAAAFILIFVMFNKDKNVAILANKQSTTKEILDRIKLTYYNLPMFLKPGIHEFNKHSITFENGCQIIAASTSAASISGKSIALLYIDEFALIPKNLVEAFIESTFPVIASSVTARILITSTPKGKNHFWRFFRDAQLGHSSFVASEISWDAHPDRDEEWRAKQIQEMGSIEKFNQEYAGDFLDTSDMLIDGKLLESLEREFKVDALDIQLTLEGKFIKGLRIFEKPIKQISGTPIKDHLYVLSVDVAEGKEQDYSAISVFDITQVPFKQVATFYNDGINNIEYPYVINQLGMYYNTAHVLIENNSIGDGVVKDLWHTLEYENIVNLNLNSQSKLKEGKYYELGIRTTKRTKKQGAEYMKFLIESGKLIILDPQAYDELYHFILHPIKYTYGAEAGYHDDLTMTVLNFSYLAKTQQYFKHIANGKDPFVMQQAKEDMQREKDQNANLIISAKDGVPRVTQQEKDVRKTMEDVSWLF